MGKLKDQVLVMKKGRFILQGTTEELIAEIEGMVWICRIPVSEWGYFENTYNVVSSHNIGNTVEARVICPSRPSDNAEVCHPSLEDLYLYCFVDEDEIVRGKDCLKRKGR